MSLLITSANIAVVRNHNKGVEVRGMSDPDSGGFRMTLIDKASEEQVSLFFTYETAKLVHASLDELLEVLENVREVKLPKSPVAQVMLLVQVDKEINDFSAATKEPNY